MHRFHVPPSDISSGTICIRDPERHHLLNVLRLTSGDDVQIYDGGGNSYTARLTDTKSLPAIASIQDHQFHPPIPPHITLFQAIPKSDKMDLIIQKTTEIGVDEIVPMMCERSVPKRKGDALKIRRERWERIAIEASKQCGRPRFPKLVESRRMDECLQLAANCELSLLLWENEVECQIKNVLRNYRQLQSIGVFIGPEGGFSDAEAENAIYSGCLPTTFGGNTLRTETAAIVAVAFAVYEFRSS
ncbi:MAG: RsmE family RNA methyltransferase [Candidatus Poribacteria bacterium]|nr:RsmE family RNA methyltransferase [Candidatus Poribacteria bacterium]MDE0505189.1 RsmE family RNA methyltransferase [Candidatus Poribacteria bacterium]